MREQTGVVRVVGNISNAMKPNTNKSEQGGIGTLPKKWAVAVQLVGTFGLAVFLVLYYVLIMQPRENERYDKLRASVDFLREAVEKNQSLLTREQAANVENLFVIAAAGELADLLAKELKATPNAAALRAKIEDLLLVQTSLLQGLVRKEGGSLSEMMTHKIRTSEIADQIAKRAETDDKDAFRHQAPSRINSS